MRRFMNSNMVMRVGAVALCGLFVTGCGQQDDADWGLAGRPYSGPESHKINVVNGKAVSPKCGDWSTDLADSSSLAMNPNHGCAVQANMAAQISDPRDLTQKPKLTRRGSTLDIDAIKSSQSRNQNSGNLFSLFFGL
jgi:hypothetical protein